MNHIYCPFCDEKLISANDPQHNYWNDYIQICDNHDPIVTMFIEENIFLCKNQYEISLGNPTILFEHTNYNQKELIHNPNWIEYPKLRRNGFLYVENGKKLVQINKYLNVTPDNFDHYLNKLKSLVIFS